MKDDSFKTIQISALVSLRAGRITSWVHAPGAGSYLPIWSEVRRTGIMPGRVKCFQLRLFDPFSDGHFAAQETGGSARESNRMSL
jgi:hypothetical protein